MAAIEPESVFGRALQQRRESINGRVANARRGLPRLQSEAVLAFIGSTLRPIAEATDALDPGRTGEIVERLLDVALPLLGRDLLGPGAHSPLLGWGWETLLPRWPRLVLEDPVRVARAVSNALHNLGAQAGARPLQWIERMGPLGEQVRSAHELLEVGKLVAWTCGLAQYRRGAIQAARGLSPELVALAIDLPLADEAARDRALARLEADPWGDPAQPEDAPRAIGLVMETGGFRGLGGPFLNPPTVVLADGGFVVSDRSRHFTLTADRYGAAFLRTTAPATTPTQAEGAAGLVASLARSLLGADRPSWSTPEGTLSLSEDGAVSWGRRNMSAAVLAGASSTAFDGRTLAITHPLSHSVFLVALTPGVRA